MFHISLQSEINDGYFTPSRLYILVISRRIVLRMKDISDELCGENQNTHFVLNNISPPPQKIVPFVS